MDTYTLAEEPKPVEPKPGDASVPPPVSPLQKYRKFIILGGIGLGFLIMFVLGILVSNAGRKPTTETIAPTPTTPQVEQSTKPSEKPSEVNTSIQYLPGKQYYDDSLAIVTKKEPYHTIYASVSRFEQQNSFTQYAKVSYFDGTTWSRENITTTGTKVSIVNNPMIRIWTISPTVTTGGGDSNTLSIMIDNKPATFVVKKLSYDISTMAYPGFTKFNYYGEGTLKTTDEVMDAYVVLTQTYASDALSLSYLSTPEKLRSDWFVFWDAEGNVYHMETLASANKGNSLQNYQNSTILNASGTSMKTNKAQLQKNNTTNQYTATFTGSSQRQLNFIVSNPLDKSTDKSYSWQIGVITGNASQDRNVTQGVGLLETIQQK